MNRQQRVAHVVALVVIGVCFLATPGGAQDCPELVGRMPGPLSVVAVAGDYAYLGGETGLLVADVSDPSEPRLVGEVGVQNGVRDIAVSGGYAYVVTLSRYSRPAHLRVIDVSTPSAPVEVGSFGMPAEALGVAVSAGYAFVVGGYGGPNYHGYLRVIDVSTPSAPVEVGFVDSWGTTFVDVAVSGDYAYVAAGSSGLRVIDVSDPTAPMEVGFVSTHGEAWEVAVWGGFAYVVDGLRLSVIDVSTPSAPERVSFIDVLNASAVEVQDGYAYVVGDDPNPAPGFLRVIDVSTPTAPVEVGSLSVDTGLEVDLAVSGNHAYVVDGWGGFRVIDVSRASAPVEVGVVSSLLYPQAVAASGGYAYVVWFLGLFFEVFDMTTPSAPVDVGWVYIGGGGGNVADVAVIDGHAYVVTISWGLVGWSSDFVVIDLSTPSAPVPLGSLHWRGDARAVAVADGHAYAVDGYGSGGEGVLRVIDVSEPSAPVEVGSIDTPGSAIDVAVSGDYAYVAWADENIAAGGLRVIDVSTPSAPVEVGFVDRPNGASGVAVTDGYAYFGGQGVSVIDVSSPSAPFEVGFLDTPGYVHDLAVSDEFVYVTVGDWPEWYYREYGDRSLRVIDVSTPSAPAEVGFYEALPTDSEEWDLGDVAIADGYVYFAANSAGLYIFNECTREVIPDVYDSFIPAAAVAAGAEGAFFSTDVEINNNGADEAEVVLQWLPRGEDNSEPLSSDLFTLAAGASLRYDNVLTGVFGLEPDALGALKLVASTDSVIGMSRTYNSPGGKAAGTFGQGLPAVRATEMIAGTAPQRIVFLSEDDGSRANMGCVNGTGDPLSISIGIFDDEGSPLETTTMDLGPWSNDQINRVFEDWAPVNGYVDVWGDSEDALFTCYGSVLDNLTSDPTTILPQVASSDTIFIPAAALAAGLEGAFFTTDVDLNNVGSTDLTYEFLWLPRGADNSEPVRSETFSLTAGAGVRYANVLGEVFGLEPDQVGALEIEASGIGLLAMSRTYNTPSATGTGTFGQGLPGVPADLMITTGVTKRIIFMSEDDDFRANLGCVNGAAAEVVVAIDLYDSDGAKLETRYMVLPPHSNWQFNGIFQDYAPVNGYVEVRTNTPDAAFTCYGSVLDNLTSDPTTLLPQ